MDLFSPFKKEIILLNKNLKSKIIVIHEESHVYLCLKNNQ
jgi:hypothetical protein